MVCRSCFFKNGAPNKINSLENVSRWGWKINPTSAKQNEIQKFTKRSGSDSLLLFLFSNQRSSGALFSANGDSSSDAIFKVAVAHICLGLTSNHNPKGSQTRVHGHVSLGIDFPIWKCIFRVSNSREKLCLHIIYFEILVFVHRSTSVKIFKINICLYW